jgi:hypothetical protein
MTADQPPEDLPLIAYATTTPVPEIRAAGAGREWMSDTNDSFASRCLPLLIANQAGWVITNNFEVTARWDGRQTLDALHITYGRGRGLPLVSSHFGYGILTWKIPFLFRTPPGWDLWVRGPANAPKDGVSPLEGIVEADWSSATFTMNWKLTRPGLSVTFDLDEPICMISPHRREDLEIVSPLIVPLHADATASRQHEEFARSRREFLAQLGTPSPQAQSWQRHYFQGRHADGDRAEQPHRRRLRLSDFSRVEL